ncbi:MAG: N-acetylmuramoyl-L-alanine amidase, partial [Oscillospiraceae bacterium]
ISGSAFNSLPALVANPKNSTDAVIAYFNNNVKMDHILKDLVFTSPDAYNKSTFDKDIVIKGASDPTFPMYMDGKEIERDENGYFAIPVTLKPGDNVINFKHKDRDRTFHITRIVQIIKQVSPEGSMVVDGGMEVSVSVVAYGDAQLSASIGGAPFSLSADDTDEDEELRGTSYKRFKGTFTAPEATTSVQNLGQIVIKASWDGFNDSKGGASVTVNKRVAVGDGVLVKVTASQAETFPTTKLNNISDPTFYPLPKGTMDYAVGSEVTYKEGSKSYTYYKLKSGLRVYSKDITATAGNLYENVIKGLRVDANKRYTVVTLNTAQPVPYKVMYTGDSIKFTFEYTKTVPSNLTLNKNPLFSSATWSGSTLTLKLARNGVFLGYRAEQTADGLVLTFNNPTSINGARIFIDPGHGVKDQGASGFNPNYPESVINWEIAQKLSDNLKEAGATVKLLTTRGVSIEPTMEQRIATARAFSPHIYMSVHSNSGGRSSVGSEAYYFYPFAKNLSGYACSEMSSALNTTNRGNKFGLFYVTRESQFVSVLCETGFVSSQSDYNKLIDSKYQERVANGLKNSINSFLKSTGGSGATGTQSTGSTTNTGGGLPKDEAGDSANSSGTISTEITLSETELSLKVGESEKLEYDAGGNKKVDISWKTSDSDVATVSTSGKVKATGKGTANITVTDSKSGSKAVCKVTVGSASSSNETPVKGVSLNLQELNIKA